MSYTIGQISKITGVSTSALRYYDQQGLLPQVTRTEGNIRQFDESVLEWLRVIDCLKRTGMTLKDIKQYAAWCVSGDETYQKRLGLYARQKEAALKQKEQIEESIALLEYKEEYLRCLSEGKEPPERKC